MKKRIVILFVLGVCFNVQAQVYDTIADKYAKTILADDLSRHLHIIASDEYEGRETGKKGQKMAMNYLINEFQNFGIKPYNKDSYTQSFKLIEQKNTNIDVSINDKTFLVNKDFSFSPNVYSNRLLEGDVVFVGYGIETSEYNSYKNIDVKGKAVYILNGKPKKSKTEKEWKMKEKIKLAKSKGAVAVFYHIENYNEVLEKYEHYFSKPKMKLIEDVDDEAIAVIKLNRKMADEFFVNEKVSLKKITKKGLKKPISFSKKYKLEINRPTTNLISENVLAYIPGTSKKDELVVLTAHYDHIGIDDSLVFNGADDDGTGTVTLIELAEAFIKAKNDGFENKRSILIMPVSGEEKGLLGSKFYTNNPVYPLENTVVNLNIDMIGRYDKEHEADSNYVYLIGSDKLSSTLHKVSEKVNELYINTTLDYRFNDENDPNRFYYRSDHYNFAKNNIPVIFYFSGVHEDYHKSTDTVEKIDFNKTEKIARLVFHTAWEIINREERIEVDVETK
jgi:hypothetical protein